MKTFVILPFILSALSKLNFVDGRRLGAPLDACSTLTPRHSVTPQVCESGDCGFRLSLLPLPGELDPSPGTYRCGELHTVIIESINQQTFRGFLVQAREFSEEFSPEAQFLGEFNNSASSQLLPCGQIPGSSITHVNATDKSMVQFTWTAPATRQSITFWYTIVQTFTQIYVQLNAHFISDARFCLSQPTSFPPITSTPPTILPIFVFSISPSGTAEIVEGDYLTVCIIREIIFVNLSVSVFTQSEDASAYDDFQPIYNLDVEFDNEEIRRCIQINTTTDFLLEPVETFLVHFRYADTEMVLRVLILDNSTECPDGGFLCNGEQRCLPQDYVCDGIADCLFKQDEYFCNNNPCQNEGSFRLRGGSKAQEGLVEVCYDGQFSSFAIGQFPVDIAPQVCSSLNFRGGGVWVNAWFEFQTVGNGRLLEGCTWNGTHLVAGCAYSEEGFSHLSDAGLRCLDQVLCNHGSVRLVGGATSREGALQVCVFGVWGLVYAYDWDYMEASVVCRSLGYDASGSLPLPTIPYLNVSSVDNIVADFIRCSGSESSLVNCSIAFVIDRTSPDGYVVGARCEDRPIISQCSNGDIRLSERDSEAQGLVEVCDEGTWLKVLSRDWDQNETDVACQQLNHTSNFNVMYSEVRLVSTTLYLTCSASNSNRLRCSRNVEVKRRRRQVFFGDFVGVRCAEIPEIIVSPPNMNDNNYALQMRRDFFQRVRCLLIPNRYHARPLNFSLYRMQKDNQLTLLERGEVSVTVFENDTVRESDTGTFLCTAETPISLSNVTININIQIPSGPSSKVYIRLSLPRADDRLRLFFEFESLQDIVTAIEEFLILRAFDRTSMPGQRAVRCYLVNRTQEDENRIRDRYECVLEIFPPLERQEESLPIIKNILAEFSRAQSFAISALNFSTTGFCDAQRSGSGGVWPEAEAGDTLRLKCVGGDIATRECLAVARGGQWLEPSIRCDTTPTPKFRCSSDNQLIQIDRVCDGIGHCLRSEDESRCPAKPTGCNNGDVRLMQGITDNDGIVEYCINGAWGGFCPQTLSLEDASVVCRQLKLPLGAIRLNNVHSLVPVHSVNFTCEGSEVGLTECGELRFEATNDLDCIQNFSRAAVRCQEPEQCSNGELRVRGGDTDREGNLEICFNNVWGSVCSGEERSRGNFSINEARVSCKQLGYEASGALVLPFGYYATDPNIFTFTRVLSCATGDEEHLRDCQITEDIVPDCAVAQIRCDYYPVENCINGSVRLRDRDQPSQGTLEICINGKWGYYCDRLRNPFEADVVCREIGFEPGVRGMTNNYGQTRRDDGIVHNVQAGCSGYEASFSNCSIWVISEECSFELSPYIVCSRIPNLYLSPPPPSDGIYVVETGQHIEINCRTAQTHPRSEKIISYPGGNSPPISCSESEEEGDSDREEVIDEVASLKLQGTYQCVSCNRLGMAGLNFTVNVIQPKGAGSTVLVRLSGPNLPRLSEILQNDNLTEESLQLGLEREIISTEVISQAEGIQTVQCHLVERTQVDIDALRDRYECNITTYPPTEPEVGIELAQRMSNEVGRESIFATAFLISGTGICDTEVDMTAWGTYTWSEAVGGANITQQCVPNRSIAVSRKCLNGGRWDNPSYGACPLQSLREVSPDEDFSATSALVVTSVQEAGESQQTSDNVDLVAQYLLSRVDVVLNNMSMVDEEFVENVVGVLDGLQQWPEEALQTDDRGAQIVQAFEAVAVSLAQQENFTELEIKNENIAVRIETVDTNTITNGRSFGVSSGNGTLDGTIGSDDTLAPDQIAAGFLPLSLFKLAGSKQSNSDPVPVVFAVLGTGGLFSIARNQVNERNTTVGSPVVSLTVGVNKTFVNLPDPVVVNVQIVLEEKFVNPRCVSYDFDLQEWVTDGCTTNYTQGSNQVTCECDHLTNFASLVDICSRTDDNCGDTKETKLALDIISIIGVILSGIGLILTILTLLLFGKLRKRDATKFHVQLSLALLGMLLVFVVGIDRTEVFEGCVTVSVLIHYFTLVSVMWMGAEALLMFQKLVIVFVQITTRYIVSVSLVCWLVPIIPAVIPAAIDPNWAITNTDTNKFCFIGDVRVFFGAFLGPIFAVLLFNLVMYIIVIVVLIRHSRNKLGKTVTDKQQRRMYIRLALSLFGVMILFGLTWVIGAFTISEASIVFQFLFAIFNSLQGFFIFIFFCVLSPDVRQLWLKVITCGRYDIGKSTTSSGVKKGQSSGKPYSAKTPSSVGTASSGLSSFPSNTYASESSAAFELSENPSHVTSPRGAPTDPSSSTTIRNEYVSQPGDLQNRPPRVVGPPTTSHAHFYKNPSVSNDDKDPTTADTTPALGYGSMSVHVNFKS